MNFSPTALFDLASYSHRQLFHNATHAWEALDRLEAYLAGYEAPRLPIDAPGAFLEVIDTIWIGEGTTIEPGAYIRGPCFIGRNCQIRHGAYIRGNVVTGDSCVIGHATEIKHSILLDNAHAAHFAYVGDSILGNGVNLGAGTKCANLRLRGDEVRIEGAPTGRRKLGAIIGDGCQIGCNAVLNPGTCLGRGVCCYPCVSVSGAIERGVIRWPQSPVVEGV